MTRKFTVVVPDKDVTTLEHLARTAGWKVTPATPPKKRGRPGADEKLRRLVLDTYAETGSYKATARELNRRGIRGAGGGKWHTSTVSRIVRAAGRNT